MGEDMRKNYLLIVLAGILAVSCMKKIELPGPVENGIRLPNNWILTPAGMKHIPVGDLPLNMALSPDGKLLAVTNNGLSRHFISLIDTDADSVVQEVNLEKSFYGLSFGPDGKHLYASGGSDEKICVWSITGSDIVPQESFSLKSDKYPGKIFSTGLAVSPDARIVYAAECTSHRICMLSAETGRIIKKIPVGEYPYDIKIGATMRKLYVSLWGEKKIGVLSLDGEKIKEIGVGDHPNAMIFSSDESILYVACANTDEVFAIDTARDTVIETINLQPYKNAPFGSTPNALALSSHDNRLYVANATNNDLAVIDISERGKSRIIGLIPVGWYPTALALNKDETKLYVANAKGMFSKPNPKGPRPDVKNQKDVEYIGGLFNGTVSVISIPDEKKLASLTKQTIRNNGFSEVEKKLMEKERSVKPTAVPRRPGEPSLIRYVIYIIKENRTYDQILGDLPQGNGDAELCLFGRDITPNHHALAEEFVLLDNFYVDAEVSADGHEWSTAGIATDFVEKVWPTVYSGRGLSYPSEGSYRIAFPTNGYIWEAVKERGLSYRSYGEFVDVAGDSVKIKHPALVGHVNERFKPWDLAYSDTLRATEFVREFREFERNGDLPRFIIMHLPNDHTSGTSPGYPTPRSMVAQNDYALGMIVEAVTKSRFWPETALFVIEDDAQNGPDHVDAHRTIAFVISPYTKRGYIDHTLYDTASMLRTMELIMGLQPMSQYDAAAFPMIDCFNDNPNYNTYTKLIPSVPLDEMNTVASYGVEESIAMDFSQEDATPEILLNQIIWKSIRGHDSEMPAPVHRRSPATDFND